MNTFGEFEHTGREDPATCAAYHDRLGAVVAQSVEPLLDAAGVTGPDRLLDAAEVTGPDRLLDAAEVTGPDRLLDVATGAGVVAAAAARRGALVLGLDFSAEQLRRARAERAGLGLALLTRQPAGVLDEVRRSAREHLAVYDEGDAVGVPMPAVVVRATRT